MCEVPKDVVIVGGGLVGALAAIMLKRKGYEIELFERRPDMRIDENYAGRSINLAMSERAMTALRDVQLDKPILDISIPMKGRMIHSIEGKQTYQPYSADGQHAIYSVSRGELNRKLLSLAEEHGAKFHFEHKCIGMDLKTGTLKFGIGMDKLRAANEDQSKAKTVTLRAKHVLGCDGAFSGVRREMFKLPRFNYSQDFLEHGYKELCIPPGPDGKHLLEKNCLHIWPRGHYMMIALPNLDGSFTCTLFFPHDGEFSFSTLNTEEKVLSFFKEKFCDAVPLMPTLLEDFFHNPTSSLCTVRCSPWIVEDKLALLGDAAHAVVPFFGQGMNCAFEDSFVLSHIIDKHGGKDWTAILKEYNQMRKKNADAIANMALENFIEMRDKVADPRFLLRKSVEHELEKRFPTQFLSRYEMVSFSNILYSHAYQLGTLNDKVLDALITGSVNSLEDVDWDKAKQLVDQFLPHSLVAELSKLPDFYNKQN